MRTLLLGVMAAMVWGTALANVEGRVDPVGVVQSANLIDAVNPSNPVPGAGILYRRPEGVEAAVAFAALDPNTAYSTWWVIFNKPRRCAGPCDDADIVAGVGQVFYAGGFVTDAKGRANHVVRLSKGAVPVGAQKLSDAFPTVFNPASETGLKFPFSAVVGVVARNHGPISAGATAAQIGSFFGGCDGHGGGFACFDQQAVFFPPSN